MQPKSRTAQAPDARYFLLCIFDLCCIDCLRSPGMLHTHCRPDCVALEAKNEGERVEETDTKP
jgi:hypothetical protein